MVRLGIYDTELKKRIIEVEFNYVGGLHCEGIDNNNWSMSHWEAQFVGHDWFFEFIFSAVIILVYYLPKPYTICA